MLMKRDEGGELRTSQEELKGSSFDEMAAVLADGTITRSRAIKLAGAALLGGAFTLLWPAEADAGKKKRRRRRRRRKAQVTPDPVPLPNDSNDITFQVENLTGGQLPAIAGVEVLSGPFEVAPGLGQLPILGESLVNFDQPIALIDVPGTTVDATVPLTITVLEGGVQSGELRLFDANGNTVDVVDLEAT